jgi:hypothetical protein
MLFRPVKPSTSPTEPPSLQGLQSQKILREKMLKKIGDMGSYAKNSKPSENKTPTSRFWFGNELQEAFSKITAPVRKAGNTIHRGYTDLSKFFHRHRFLSWSLPALSIGVSLVRATYNDMSLEAERDALIIPTPQEELAKVLVSRHIMGTETEDTDQTLTWNEDLNLLQAYPNDKNLVQFIVPKMFENVFTPEASLILSHTLLETFALSPSLGSFAKEDYETIVRAEFTKANQRFGTDFVIPMMEKGWIDIPENKYSIDTNGDGAVDVTIHGELRTAEQEEAFIQIEDHLKKEKSALLTLTSLHNVWVIGKLAGKHPELLDTISKRTNWLAAYYQTDWKYLELKLKDEKAGLYSYHINDGYEKISTSYKERTKDYWEIYFGQIFSSQSSVLGIAGFMAHTYFVESNVFTFIPAGLYFGAGAGSFTSPSTAYEEARDQKPIPINNGIYSENL